MKHVLDRIAAQRYNPNAFEEWEEYRRKLTDIVIGGISKGSTLAIYGAGRCNDIDLNRLADHFSEITLLDCDEAAMQAALARYHLAGEPGIRTECFDFVGITEDDYEKLAIDMNGVLDSGEITETTMRPVIEAFYASHEDFIYRSPRYDAVLAAGLHSQLNQTAVSMWRTLCADRGMRLDPVCDPVCNLFHEWTYPIIVRFNQLLFYSAKQKAFIAYEQSIQGHEGSIQGAMQLREDLQRRIEQRQANLNEQHELIWPQNRANGMIFEMIVDELIIRK